jgi:hypothetical protein
MKESSGSRERTAVGKPVQARPGCYYRAFDDPERAVGPDVSISRQPFGYGGAYEIEFKVASADHIDHNLGRHRGTFDPASVTPVFYEPDYWIDEVKNGKLAEDLPRFQRHS